jgi:hypothetical protein
LRTRSARSPNTPRSQRAELQRGLAVQAQLRLAHTVVARGGGDAPCHGVVQAHADAVVPQLQADFAARVHPASVWLIVRLASQAEHGAAVELLELVAVGLGRRARR